MTPTASNRNNEQPPQAHPCDPRGRKHVAARNSNKKSQLSQTHLQVKRPAGIGPNKAAGSKGGIRRQGSKR